MWKTDFFPSILRAQQNEGPPKNPSKKIPRKWLFFGLNQSIDQYVLDDLRVPDFGATLLGAFYFDFVDKELAKVEPKQTNCHFFGPELVWWKYRYIYSSRLGDLGFLETFFRQHGSNSF